MRLVPVFACLTLFVTSCASNTTQSRIASNGSAYSMLKPEHRRLVAVGKISEGMPKQAVSLAWGKPSRVTKLEEDGKLKERWIYQRSRPTHSTSLGIGYGRYSRYGRYDDCRPFGSAGRSYVQETYGSVVFHQEQVESWERIE